MKQYIGTKVVQAEPAYKCKDGTIITEAGNLPPEGCQFGYKVVYPDGYESFSPRYAFEEAYRPTNGMTFGLALEALKNGSKVARAGWNGKGMFVVFQKGYPQGINCNKQTAEAWSLNEGDLFRCEPYLQIRMANGSHSMWVPSINDCLAEDWHVVK